MKHLTDMMPFVASKDQDERARLNLLPVRVIKTWGGVSNAEWLLKDHPMQVFMGKCGACRLENGSEGGKAALLIDFGRELHGNLRLTSSNIESVNHRAHVLIRFGESAMEALAPVGQMNATNDHAVRDHVYDIGMLSTTETNESGFRFALIELEDTETAVDIQALHMTFIYRDIPYLGSFECSDPLLEEIWKTAAYTVHLNMQGCLWDGIKRDRLAWQGDMHTEIMAIENVFGANPVVPKSLDFLRDGTPAGEWINGYSSYTLWWIVIQAEWYRYTGDLDYLKQQRDFLKAQLELAIANVDENGVERFPEFRFLDWKNLENKPATHAGLQALLMMALKDGFWLLNILDEADLSRKCLALITRMCKYVPDCGGSKQAAALLSLSGLGDAKELNESIIAPGGASGYSTFMGYYLLAAKAKAGDWQGALDDLRAYWGGMLKLGATTFWEDFDLDWMENAARIDEITPEGRVDVHGRYGAFCYEHYRHSLCHGWASGPVPFLTRHILGITAVEPGCKRLRIEPHLGDLEYARGTCPTPLGVVYVSHTRKADGTIETKYEAPEGIEIQLA